MLKRRTALKLGMAGLFNGYLPVHSVFAMAPAASPPARPPTIIYDSNYQESLAFGESLEANSLNIHDLKTGLAELWYKDLRPALREQPSVLFGLTDRTGLFCLEELARDLNLKMRFRIDHVAAANSRIQHYCAGPAELNDFSRNLKQGSGYGRQCAHLYSLSASPESAVSTNLQNPQKMTGPFLAKSQNILVTWMLG